MHVEIGDLFQKTESKIVINQHNTDNKDTSINGVVLLLTDKESVDQLVEIVKSQLANKK